MSKPKKYTKLLIIDIEEEMKEWLRKKAKEEKISMAELVRRVIIKFLNK